MTSYDCMDSCNKCGGENDVTVMSEDFYSGQVVTFEAGTLCKRCDFSDYWAFGFFESGDEGYDMCRKYSTGGW